MVKGRKKKESRVKKNRRYRDQISDSMGHYQEYSLSDSRIINCIKVRPRNENQTKYVNKLKNDNNKIVIATGPAGTGKTLLASQVGIDFFLKGEFEKIIITRPVMTVDEDIGFLPGTLEDKMNPWMSPIYDIFGDYFYQTELKNMIEEKIIEICPLAFMRGRTFKNAWIIADEMQNATKNQLKMLLTRIGENSRLIVTGDLKQNDRKDGDDGLNDFLNKVKRNSTKLITYQELTSKDVERCDVVKEVLSLYGD